MIGQHTLLSRIKGQIERNKFPKFSILIGEHDSGKTTLATEIGGMLNIPCIVYPANSGGVQKIIQDSYNIGAEGASVIYLITHCDNMSRNVIDALLGIINNPPENVYFILTCERLDNIVPAIKNKSVTYMLEPYSYEDKCDYLDCVDTLRLSTDDIEFMLDVASNIGDLQRLMSMDLVVFKHDVLTTIDNIEEGPAVLDKYDLNLFLKAYISECENKVREGDSVLYVNIIAITGDCLQQLNIGVTNKSELIDTWVSSVKELLTM